MEPPPGNGWNLGTLRDMVMRLVSDRDRLAERVTRLESRLDVRNGRSEGRGQGWYFLVGGVGLILTLLSITTLVLALTNRGS